MDKLAHYRTILRDLILKYASYKPSVGDVEVEAVIDEEKGHFELMNSGWVNGSRVHGSVIHLDIRKGKIYVQYDGTNVGIANELVQAGIPKEDIVLAFKHPDIRQHTGYAIA
jgi:hypothetical protein